MRLEHIGIAVDDIEATVGIFERLLQTTVYKEENVASEGVVTHFLDVGGTKVELLEATGEESVISRFVERRGPGVHHLAFHVDDLAGTMVLLQERGFRVLGDGIRPGADAKRVFFLHPHDTAGVLIEFCSPVAEPT